MSRFVFRYLIILCALGGLLILFAWLNKTRDPRMIKPSERIAPKRKFVIDNEDENFEMRYFLPFFSLK